MACSLIRRGFSDDSRPGNDGVSRVLKQGGIGTYSWVVEGNPWSPVEVSGRNTSDGQSGGDGDKR